MMMQTDFVKAWGQAVYDFLNGSITYDELLEFGTIDEYFDYISDMEDQ